MTSACLPIAGMSVPKVKDIPVERSDLVSYAFMKGFGPADISVSLALIYVVAFH